jgi:O-antigen biosynthesis protein
MDTAQVEIDADEQTDFAPGGGRRGAASAPRGSAPEADYRLVPAIGVRVLNGEFHAISLPYWLKLEPMHLLQRHRWIRLRYSSSFFDEPVRPLIRFVTADGRHATQAMNGTILGSAEWVGRIPRGTVEILISPGRRLGPFAFRIDEVQNVSRTQLMREGMQGSPPSLLWSLTSKLINSPETTWHVLKYARGGMPMERYWEWRARLSRPLDLAGIDKPRWDWSTGPTFHLLLDVRAGNPADFRATLDSLRDQAYARWRLHVRLDAGTPPALLQEVQAAARVDLRIAPLAEDSASPRGFSRSDWAAVIQIGDLLPEYALAVLANTATADPDLEAIYSDEDVRGANGLFQSPLFKPDWSPLLHRSIRYLGRLLVLRLETLARKDADIATFLVEEEAVLDRILPDIQGKTVGHVRRVLYNRCEHRPRTIPRIPNIQITPATSDWPDVSIVIPTRDRANLLATCIRSLRERTDYPSLEVVIVDNGTTEPAARRLIDGLRKDKRFKILNRPGPFNYARLSNDGAREARGQMLVFLNNDTELVDSGWLKALVHWARQPEIGVAGAKLLFPSGKIQHAGVILGMGGIAGHVYRRSMNNASGYLNQLEVAREVTAVTAACIAVERSKFEAVSGFDEQNLPVDLNDIDLCLRIAERGWTNIWTPEAVAIHLQSASRGVSIDPFGKYRSERSYFVERWAEAIRDDPYFHPGFSLFAPKPALA